MAVTLSSITKADEEAVVRTRQLLAFNQFAVVLAIGAAFYFYFAWLSSAWYFVGVAWLSGFFVFIHLARRRLTVDTLVRIGIMLLLGNWATAVVLTALAPFTYPLGILQVIVPIIAAGPVLERRELVRVLVGATILTGVVVGLGLGLEESELNDSMDEDVQDVIVMFGVPIMTIAVAIGTWDAHERQEDALETALTNNELIRDSRARLVTAADNERSRIERNLHDGAQQQLVAVAMELRLLRSTRDEGEELDPLIGELESALENLRELAHGIYPPLLRSRGLAEAINAAAVRSPLQVRSHVVDQRFDPAIEAAVYFCCLEALTNATKHAGTGAEVAITIDLTDGTLSGVIHDNGPGFTAAPDDWGTGLRNMEDRIVAAGGELTIDDADGTRVSFTVPASPLG